MQICKVGNKNIRYFLPIIDPLMQQELQRSDQLFAIGAVDDGTACGILIYRMMELSFDIVYLAV